jgi:hypothetical protein
MIAPPDHVSWSSVPELFSVSVDGRREVEEFERLMDAYDPRCPETGQRMIGAFLRFQELGYEAYFQGVPEAPESILVRPLLAGMWQFGFDVAEFDAATRRCKCDCDKRYVWGQGYGKCPRIPQGTQSR